MTLKVMIEGQEVAAMLDTGATPCVIDKSTADNLGLCRRLVHERSKVYGLCNNAVQVLGHVMAAIKVGTLEPEKSTKKSTPKVGRGNISAARGDASN